MSFRGASAVLLIGSVLLFWINELRAQDTTLVQSGDAAVHTPAVLPVRPAEVPAGPLPPGTRYTFNKDSLVWTNGITLADLLSSIPGVYVARAGFWGLPEYVVYGGHGAQSIEVYWDGQLLQPLGGDSTYLDLGRINLTYLNRVEVEILPSRLLVFLVSERHGLPETRSSIKATTGDFATGAYAGIFQSRWRSGVGIGLAGDFMSTEGGGNPGKNFQTFDGWAKFDWLPDSLGGVTFQLRRQDLDRDPLDVNGVPAVTERHGSRTDIFFSFFRSSKPNGLGIRGEAGLGSSSWTSDSTIADQRLRKAYVELGYRSRAASGSVRFTTQDRRTTGQVDALFGWAPLRGVVLSGVGRWRRHDGGRTSRRLDLSASIGRGPFAVIGQYTTQKEVQAPAILSDSAQKTTEKGVRVRLTGRLLVGEVGVVKRDSYQPLPFQEIPAVPALNRSDAANFFTARATLFPGKPLTFDAWYSNPTSGASVDFQPPTHTRAQVTFQSKFWKTFRSGAFRLKLYLAADSWSRGTGGADGAGAPLELEGVTFYETYLEFQLVGFTAFWSLRNAYNAREQYIPGLRFPTNAQIFGARWSFTN